MEVCRYFYIFEMCNVHVVFMKIELNMINSTFVLQSIFLYKSTKVIQDSPFTNTNPVIQQFSTTKTRI